MNKNPALIFVDEIRIIETDVYWKIYLLCSFSVLQATKHAFYIKINSSNIIQTIYFHFKTSQMENVIKYS